MTTKQLIDNNGDPWPIYWDTSANQLGIFQPTPTCTVEVANAHPGTQDTRLAVGNSRNDGSRGVVTISGPTDHVSFAFGGPQTGGLAGKFGIGNQGHYASVLQPGVQGQPCHWTTFRTAGNADLIARVAALEAVVFAMARRARIA